MKLFSTLYFAIFFLIATPLVRGQEKQLDSLIQSISDIENVEKRLDSLTEITANYRDQDPEMARLIAIYGIKESNALNSKINESLFYKEIGVYHRRKNQLDSALYYYHSAYRKATEANDSLAMLSIKGSIANVLKAKGDYETAIKTFKEIIASAEKNNNSRALVATHINLAALYIRLKEPTKAKNVLLDGLQIKSELDHIAHPKIYNNLVVVYLDLKNNDSALFYAQKAEKMITSKRSLANLYINKGIIYTKQEKFELAEQSYRKALDNYKALKSTTGEIKSYNNLAQVALAQNKLSNARSYIDQARPLIEQSKDISFKNYYYETEVEYYIAAKDYKNALLATEKVTAINDSLLNQEKQKAISEFEVKFETEKKEREKQEAQNQAQIAQLESARNRTYFMSALAVVVLLLIASLLYFSRLRTRKKAELITLELKETQKRLALEKQYRNSELKALKAQMNPHFIFNALNSIQEYIILNEKNLASDYLGKFADLMRNYLHQSDAGTITLQEEVESLEMYLELEALRFGEDLNYTIEVAKNIATESVQIPTMLVQPYAENALKHGLLHRKGQRNLKVTFSQPNEKTLRCTIIDNGIGRKAAAALKDRRGNTHKSFATQANENRLDLLNYKKNKQIGVDITDLYDPLENPIGTKVTLDIPL